MKINGTLVFDASSASEIQNLRVEKVTTATMPTWTSADAGRLLFNTDTNVLIKGGNAAFENVATGGSAFSQVEGDAIETTLGSLIKSDGTQQMSNLTFAAGATDLTTALNNLAATVVGHESLYELGDVALSANHPTGNKFLYVSGTGSWTDHTLVLADVSDVTTTAAELNQLHSQGAVAADFAKLHAVTTTAAQINNATSTAATTTELDYSVGVTSAIQTQLNGKQASNAGLTAVSTLLDGGGTGILVQTGVDTVADRTLVAPSAGITITNPAGVGGNPTFALANDLAALEGLATTGYVVRTGDGTATTRSITGTAGNITVTNGDGVTSDTSVNLASVTDSGAGTFKKITTDGFGRVTGTTAVVASDITSLVDSSYVNTTGDTMTGSLVMNTGTHITLTDTAVNPTDATNKAYVDALTAGLSWKQAVRAATTGNISISSAASGYDGVTLTAGDRVLVLNQTAPAENGIYVFNGTAAALTRATDMDQAAEFEGASVLVKEGTTQQDFGYTQVNAVTTVGTDPVVFHQFTGSSVLTPGVGLSQAGSVLNVNLGAGIAELPTSEVGIDLYNAAGGNLALILTTDGSTHSTATGAQLFLLLDTGSGLTQTATGLKISAGGVTNAMLVNSTVGLNGDAGTSTLALGQTLQVIGTSAQGLSTSVSGQTVTLTNANASSSQKGVATFNTASFAVTTGDVTIKAAGVTNAQLANSSFGVAGTTGGTQQIALGGVLSVLGGTSPITTVSSAGTVTINVAAATASTLGLASFPAAQFSLSTGAVTIAHTLGQGAITNVATGVDTAAEGDLLVYNHTSSKWENRTTATVAGTMLLGDLSDVGTAPATTTQTVLVANGTTWNAKKIYHLETITTPATTWVVVHNIGQKYCNVTIVDSTDNVVIPQSIVFTDANTVTVTFNTAISGAAVIMGIA